MGLDLKNLNRTLGGGKSRGKKPWWYSLIAMLVAAVTSYLKQRKPAQRSPDADASATRSRTTTTTRKSTESSNESPKRSPTRSTSTSSSRATKPLPQDAHDDLADLIRSQRSDVVVQSAGTVIKILPDDSDGDHHQRFLVRLASDDVVLIAHNIDLAPRVPVREGDIVKFKGEFEWNDRGGCMHWTHKDKKRWHEDGWVELEGKRYD